MATATMPKLDIIFDIPAAMSVYQNLCATHSQNAYTINTSRSLVKTENYYHFIDSIIGNSEGRGMSAANEELFVQLQYEKVSEILKNITDEKKTSDSDIALIKYLIECDGEIIIDPRKAKFFDDLFARGPDKEYLSQWTETFLRVPKGKSDPSKPDYTDEQGRKFWMREWGKESEVKGIIYVPEGNGRVVPYSKDPNEVWDLFVGIPRITSDNENDTKYGNYNITRFYFNPNPNLDIYGHHDVVVDRWGGRHHGGDGRCLDIGAVNGRSMNSVVSFRPVVRGSVPEIDTKIDTKNIEKILLEKMARYKSELGSIEFLKKYLLS